MRYSSIPMILCGFLLLAPRPAAGTGFTLARFLEVPTLGSLAVSPDGRSVAYTWSRRDLEDDDRITRLWLGDVETGGTRQLTFTDDGVGGVSWRPDGALSYLRTHEDARQVWVNPLDGSEPRPVTAVDGGVGAYWWSPDGKWLAVLADPTEPEDEEAAEEAAEVGAEETQADAEADPREARVYDVPEDRHDWTVFDRLEQPSEYQQLWLVPVDRNEPVDEPAPRRLTSAPWHPYHVAWSPDGSHLAVTFNPRFSSLVDEEQQIALMDVVSGEFEVITPLDRHSSMASFSPDGKSLAYFTDREADFRAYLNLKDVVVRDLESGAETVVTPGVTWTLAGYGSTPGETAKWGPRGQYLYLSAADGTDLDLVRIDVKKRTAEKLTDLEGNLFGLSLGGGSFAYLETALDKPGTLFAGRLGGKVKEIDNTNGSVATFGLQPARELRLPGHDGGFVEGFLFLPPGAGDTDRLPAIIEMHGGPFSRYGNAWTTRYPWQVLSQEGFAVFIVNPRGGTGYGADFLRGVYRNFGTDDYLDIMAAVDALVLQGTIDPDRLGFTGYSYGGLMTNTVVSRTDRFKAAVSIAGIWNYTSAMGQNNPQLFIDSYLRPWDEDLQRMWEHSPASRADLITTPTLIMHGKDDEPVDPRQSIEMFSYLQLNGVPSRLVLYPGEGHGINKPSHMIDYQTRELQWFRHYLLGAEGAVGAEDPVPVEP
ncbi:S9 family peptidase [bacterium]|nr:S9 family peptidase [bacterium]